MAVRKEVLFAILLGILLGAAIAFGIWRANKALSPKIVKTDSQNEVGQPQNDAAKQDLVITSPEDKTIVDQEKIILKGTATPNAIIVIIAGNQEVIIQAKNDSTFEQEITLQGGINKIKVTTYDSEGNKKEQEITVVYSTEFK